MLLLTNVSYDKYVLQKFGTLLAYAVTDMASLLVIHP